MNGKDDSEYGTRMRDAAPPTAPALGDAAGRAAVTGYVTVDCTGNVVAAREEALMERTERRVEGSDGAVDLYDEHPVETREELEALVALRAALTWSAWKAHPRFKRDRVLREAQRRLGVVPGAPANDVGAVVRRMPRAADGAEGGAEIERALAEDADFETVCDARRDGWIEAQESDAALARQAEGDDDE